MHQQRSQSVLYMSNGYAHKGHDMRESNFVHYRISSIRRPGYYLFQRSVGGATIRGGLLFEGGYYNISRVVARKRHGSSRCCHSRIPSFFVYTEVTRC